MTSLAATSSPTEILDRVLAGERLDDGNAVALLRDANLSDIGLAADEIVSPVGAIVAAAHVRV